MPVTGRPTLVGRVLTQTLPREPEGNLVSQAPPERARPGSVAGGKNGGRPPEPLLGDLHRWGHEGRPGQDLGYPSELQELLGREGLSRHQEPPAAIGAEQLEPD